jgi:hypothetical protein
VSDALLSFMVKLLGHYRRHVRKGCGEANAIHPDFDEEAFLADAPASTTPFLELLRASQLFEVWLRHHVDMDSAVSRRTLHLVPTSHIHATHVSATLRLRCRQPARSAPLRLPVRADC